MDTFNILVVDDELRPREQSEQAFEDESKIKVYTAKNATEATELINKHFFHVAYIDLQLERNDELKSKAKSNFDGKQVLNKLMTDRPSCKRYLLTYHPNSDSHYRTKFFDLLNPLDPMVHGAISKEEMHYNFTDIIRGQAMKYFEHPIKINDTKKVYDKIIEKYSDNNNILVTEDEIDYILSSMFGQNSFTQTGSNGDITNVELEFELLKGGRSRSIVFTGRPMNNLGNKGILCVLKIGPRDSTMEEYRRYVKYVKFNLSQNRRVETLGFFLADTLGVICYSFAGESPDKVKTLEELITAQSNAVIPLIKALFDPLKKEWYEKIGKSNDLATYFFKLYNVNKDVSEKVIYPFIYKFSQDNNLTIKDKEFFYEMPINGCKLSLPKKEFIIRQRGVYKECIVHGDLNAGNIIIQADDKDENESHENLDNKIEDHENVDISKAILIDYMYTGIGPICMDFAALESSVRLLSVRNETDWKKIIPTIAIEKDTWKSAWGETKKDDNLPYWSKISKELIRLCKLNFVDITQEEYARTCLFWALRIVKIQMIKPIERLRLLIWISMLCDSLQIKNQ